MENEITRFSDLPSYSQNPFIVSILDIKMKNKMVSISTIKSAVVNGEGDHVGDKMLMVTKKVDKEEFIKVYKNQLSLIFELSRSGQKVLTYFIQTLGVNKDYIIFDKNVAKEISGLSSTSSIYSGLTELVLKNVIAKSDLPFMYYINPQILFNGDRLTVINKWEKDEKLGISSKDNTENW